MRAAARQTNTSVGCGSKAIKSAASSNLTKANAESVAPLDGDGTRGVLYTFAAKRFHTGFHELLHLDNPPYPA